MSERKQTQINFSNLKASSFISKIQFQQSLLDSFLTTNQLKELDSWKRDTDFNLQDSWVANNGLYGFSYRQSFDCQVSVQPIISKACQLSTQRYYSSESEQSLLFPASWCDCDIINKGHCLEICFFVLGNPIAFLQVFEKQAELTFFSRPLFCPYSTSELWKQLTQRICGWGDPSQGKGLQLSNLYWMDWSVFPSKRPQTKAKLPPSSNLGTQLPLPPELGEPLPLSLRWFRLMQTSYTAYELSSGKNSFLVDGLAIIAKQMLSKCQSLSLLQQCLCWMQQTNAYDLAKAILSHPDIVQSWEVFPYEIQKALHRVPEYITNHSWTIEQLCNQTNTLLHPLFTLFYISWTNVPFLYVAEPKTAQFYEEKEVTKLRNGSIFEPRLCIFKHPFAIQSSYPLLQSWFLACTLLWRMDLYCTSSSLQSSSSISSSKKKIVVPTTDYQRCSHVNIVLPSSCVLTPNKQVYLEETTDQTTTSLLFSSVTKSWRCSLLFEDRKTPLFSILLCDNNFVELITEEQQEESVLEVEEVHTLQRFLEDVLPFETMYLYFPVGKIHQRNRMEFEKTIFPYLEQRWEKRIANGTYFLSNIDCYGALYQNQDWYKQCWEIIEKYASKQVFEWLSSDSLPKTPTPSLTVRKLSVTENWSVEDWKSLCWSLRSAFPIFEFHKKVAF